MKTVLEPNSKLLHEARSEKTESQAAFVLPKDYGWGMRSPEDRIWGLWPSDDLSPVIWENMNKLIDRYGLKLDIIYDDPQFNFEDKYSHVYSWNSTDLSALSLPSINGAPDLYTVLVIGLYPSAR